MFPIITILLVKEEENKNIHVLFNTYHPVSATIRRASNYHYVANVTEFVKYDDGWMVVYNKRYVMNVKWGVTLYDGDKVLFDARLIGTCPFRQILLTAPNDPNTIYGSYTFHDSSQWYFNITLDLTHEITEFDVVIHYSCNTHIKFIVDYISFERLSSVPSWHDQFGSVITKYRVSFDYIVNISNTIDPSSVTLEISANASIVTPNGTAWISNHGTFYEMFPTDPFQLLTWESRWVKLPLYPPPFCMWSGEEYGDDGSNCNERSQMNIIVSVSVSAFGRFMNGTEWVSDVKVVDNIRNYPIYWY